MSYYSEEQATIASAHILLESNHVQRQPGLCRILPVDGGSDGREAGPAEQVYALLIAQSTGNGWIAQADRIAIEQHA